MYHWWHISSGNMLSKKFLKASIDTTISVSMEAASRLNALFMIAVCLINILTGACTPN